jgi:hypothetical protein
MVYTIKQSYLQILENKLTESLEYSNSQMEVMLSYGIKLSGMMSLSLMKKIGERMGTTINIK